MWSWSRNWTAKSIDDVYDFIIVGGGTAGCVLANRLSEGGRFKVLLLERGGFDDGWLSRIPLFSNNFMATDTRQILMKSTPQAHIDGRELELMQSSTLGGATKMNAMLYTRGIPAEYNSWNIPGWSYEDVQPYFTRSETNLNYLGGPESKHHGTTGEWEHRSYEQNFWGHTPYIIKGAENLGLPYIDDPNSPSHPPQGCARMHYTIDRQGYRCSCSRAFLPPSLVASRKHELHVCTKTMVTKVEVERSNDGKLRTAGVNIQNSDGSGPSRLIRCLREVIISSGPFGSPQLLMLSGIGPEKHLEEHGIPVVKDLPAVGSNLQDHLGVQVQYMIPMQDSLLRLQAQPLSVLREMFLYIFFGLGLLLSPVLELSLFAHSRHVNLTGAVEQTVGADNDSSLPENLPDIEIMPIAWGDITEHQAAGKLKSGGMGFLPVLLRPKSKGTVRLVSSNPRELPVVDPNYLSFHEDWEILRKSVILTMAVKEQMASQGYEIIDYSVPESLDDEGLDKHIRRWARSTTHYSSTCRMTASETGGVVDGELRVFGVAGLRVVDSSIFPQILSAHLAAATVMVAEKASDIIKTAHINV